MEYITARLKKYDLFFGKYNIQQMPLQNLFSNWNKDEEVGKDQNTHVIPVCLVVCVTSKL